jgi:hypothetical protein
METRKDIRKDLCPRKPDRKLIDIGDTNITVTVAVSSAKPIVASKFERCVKAGEAEVDRYQKVIQEEVLKLESKIKGAKDKGDIRTVQQMAADTSTSIKNSCRSMQSAVEVAVKKQLTSEAQGDRNLLEARVIAGVKMTLGVIKIAKDVTELAVTAGADIASWYSLAKDCVGLGTIIYDQCKGETKLRNELLDAIGAMSTDKQRQVIEHQKAQKSTTAVVESFFKDIYRKYKPKADEAETVRKKYRNHVTKMRQDVDNLFSKIEALQGAMKRAPNLKEGVTIGAKLMQMKREGNKVKEKFYKAEEFSKDMAFLMTEAGVKVDERTIAQKLQALDGLGDVVKSASEIKSAAEEVKKLIENIVKLV